MPADSSTHPYASLTPDVVLNALEGVGHEAPPAPIWDVAVPAILRHTRAGSE